MSCYEALAGAYDALTEDVGYAQRADFLEKLLRRSAIPVKLGYARAARVMDQMEERGIIGPSEGSKPRRVLITKDEWMEIQLRRDI